MQSLFFSFGLCLSHWLYILCGGVQKSKASQAAATLKWMRKDEDFNLLSELVKEKAETFDIERPFLPRKRRKPNYFILRVRVRLRRNVEEDWRVQFFHTRRTLQIDLIWCSNCGYHQQIRTTNLQVVCVCRAVAAEIHQRWATRWRVKKPDIKIFRRHWHIRTASRTANTTNDLQRRRYVEFWWYTDRQMLYQICWNLMT